MPSFLIVCKAFHARRCLMLYQMAFPSVDFKVCPVHCYNIMEENWHTTEQGVESVLGELARCGNQFVGDIKLTQFKTMRTNHKIYRRERDSDERKYFVSI